MGFVKAVLWWLASAVAHLFLFWLWMSSVPSGLSASNISLVMVIWVPQIALWTVVAAAFASWEENPWAGLENAAVVMFTLGTTAAFDLMMFIAALTNSGAGVLVLVAPGAAALWLWIRMREERSLT